MLTQEQIARLNPEQLRVALIWESEKEARDLIYEEILAAIYANDLEVIKTATDKMVAITPMMCEHDRFIACSCADCDEIGRLLNPELYCIKCQEPLTDDPFATQDWQHDVCEHCLEERP